ncbi:GDCCVxC domain-containing (seleno)protein [Aminobacter sp. SS-2016]|uniref:GDCCVxC domain-containing (seleno)protein n=1 Tax=Aminobacter sp. Y103A TaxID=1870862 RepID=UPI0025729FE2|nr:GDCCVxC domain-containing (seleno)protein [Aminobacter sp. SS-2016]
MTVLTSIITCPRCRYSMTESMALDACQVIYECQGCATVMRPRAGDCCVFCSYGSVPCPSKQIPSILDGDLPEGIEPRGLCASSSD